MKDITTELQLETLAQDISNLTINLEERSSELCEFEGQLIVPDGFQYDCILLDEMKAEFQSFVYICQEPYDEIPF